MPSFRPVLPALFGILVLYLSISALAHDLRYYSENAVGVVRASIMPIAIGIALLLTALAISRRTRAGYLLALATAVLLILGGLWLCIIEIGYIARGDYAAQWAPIFFVGGGGWIILWLIYIRSLRRARSSFAPSWTAIDRRFAIVIAALIAFSGAASLSLGMVETSIAQAGVANRDLARKAAEGTSLVVEAREVAFDAGGAAGTSAPVGTMTLTLSVHSLATYELAVPPTLCLTDLATASDPTYKPDVYCWGIGGRPITLDAGFSRLMVEDGTVTFDLDVRRADSLCAFGAGRWQAELRVAPRLADGVEDGSALTIESYSVVTTFLVHAIGETVPGDPLTPTTDCIAASVLGPE